MFPDFYKDPVARKLRLLDGSRSDHAAGLQKVLLGQDRLRYRFGFRKFFDVSSTSVKGAVFAYILRVTYKTAWSWRTGFVGSGQEPFEGPVEYDETFIGGKEGKKHAKKRKRPGGGYGGKEVLAGAYDHATGQLHTKVIKNTTGNALKAFVGKTAVPGAMVITDEARGYFGLKGYTHRYVKHAAGEYVTEDGITTNSIESHWAIVKRGYNGVYHAMSPKRQQSIRQRIRRPALSDSRP